MSKKITVVAALLVLVGAMGLKTAVAGNSNSSDVTVMANGGAPTPPSPWKRNGGAPTPPSPWKKNGGAPTPPSPWK
jgi:hypothetical protein